MMNDISTQDQSRRGARRTLFACVGLVCGMIGLSFASVPLYQLFCTVTGYGGTTQVAADKSAVVTDRSIRIRFDATTNQNLPWTFQPVQREVHLKVGENAVAFYRAKNNADVAITGVATFNVTPQKAGLYFNKIDCFCFTEQTLKPNEMVDMPVAFFVDPDINNDPNLSEVKTITLSYTFFTAPSNDDETKKLGTAETPSKVAIDRSVGAARRIN
ncbi:MAG: cytochrome c oxidase assembly protein subunit 11 [Alphaproteobacteria bacterium]|jgi:cytochrome c oxidase assembly protein subunit 11